MINKLENISYRKEFKKKSVVQLTVLCSQEGGG